MDATGNAIAWELSTIHPEQARLREKGSRWA